MSWRRRWSFSASAVMLLRKFPRINNKTKKTTKISCYTDVISKLVQLFQFGCHFKWYALYISITVGSMINKYMKWEQNVRMLSGDFGFREYIVHTFQLKLQFPSSENHQKHQPWRWQLQYLSKLWVTSEHSTRCRAESRHTLHSGHENRRRRRM